MNPNDTQVGGTHYAADYQHWDYVLDCKLGYLQAQATKYLTRWRKKNGIQDLLKARHYATKLESVLGRDGVAAPDVTFNRIELCLKRFFLAHPSLDTTERSIFALLSHAHTHIEVTSVICKIDRLQREYPPEQGDATSAYVNQ